MIILHSKSINGNLTNRTIYSIESTIETQSNSEFRSNNTKISTLPSIRAPYALLNDHRPRQPKKPENTFSKSIENQLIQNNRIPIFSRWR